jgi:nucleoside-diphosphate-sugar epimerase
MSKILIIGSSGYIGSRMSKFLAESGFDVQGLDLTESHITNFQTTKRDYRVLEKRDIRDYKYLILLAANSSVAQSKSDPIGTIENNILGLQNLISMMNDNQILFFASSASVYDGVKNYQAHEKEVLAPSRNIYDLSKRTGEDLIVMNKVNSVIFRFGTVNGPSPNMRYDLVINAMVLSAIRDKKIFLANPNVHRAILSIDDLSSAVLNAIQTNCGASKVEILNLVSFNTTIGEIAMEISRYFNVPIVNMESGSTYDFSVSSRMAEERIAFEPKDKLRDLIMKLEIEIQESHHD